MSAAKGSIATPKQWEVVLPFFVFVLHSLIFRAWIVDDAGISFAYARNLIHGYGLVAQRGVEPVEGFSNPLWTFLIAPLFITELPDPTLYVKVLSVVLILGTFFLVNRINRSLFGTSWWSRAATVATLMVISLNTSFVVWTTSGLENPLYAFLCGLYCLLMVQFATNGARRPGRVAAYAGLTAAGLALTRPDGVVLFAAFPIVLAICAMKNLPQGRYKGKSLAIFLIAAILPFGAYAGFRYFYFHDLLPNTYYAINAQSVWDFLRLKYFYMATLSLFFRMFMWQGSPIILLFLAGCIHLIFYRWKTSTVMFLVPCLACTWVLFCLLPWDWMGEYRFATPFFLVFPLMLVALLVDELHNSRLSPSVRKGAFLTIVTLCVVNSAIVYIPRSSRWLAEEPNIPFETVKREFGMQFNMYADELKISDASLLCPDVGGTLYVSRLRVYDLGGLCDRKIAKLINENPSALCNYVFGDLRPTFIHVYNGWSLDSGFFDDPRFKEMYVAIREYPDVWTDEEGIHSTYQGDYVLKTAVASEKDLERVKHKVQESSQ